MKIVLKCLIALFFIAIFSNCEREDVKPSTTKEFVSKVKNTEGPGDKGKDDDI